MNNVKRRVLSGEVVTAAWAELGSPDSAEAMARNGWPVIVIDGEHGIGDLEQMVHIARAIEAAGGEVVLRVPDGSDTTIKRVLDRGFRSLIVPQVNTADYARAIVSSCMYPSRGRRGYAAPVVRASGFGARTGYAQAAHEELLLMVQIEHTEAVDNLTSIAAVPGVDMLFAGPNDLAASAGYLEKLLDLEPQALLHRIESSATAAGKPLATIVGAGRDFGDLACLGYRFIIGPNDVSLLVNSAVEAAAHRDLQLSGIGSRPGTNTPSTRRPQY